MSEKAPPAERLEAVLLDQLANAADAAQKGLRPYESLRNLGEVIGGEYGDRVLFELFQNAHDAHDEGGAGSILLKLVIHDDEQGDLYVANTGRGFDWDNVDAIRNVGLSSKSVGEGIGNKGLGFRSVETLTNDVRIYSQARSASSQRFDGYCFRFADRAEIEREAMRVTSAKTAAKVARELPRYLAAVPLAEQSDEIRAFAQEGFATVVHLPLRGEAAVSMARSQASALAEVEVPLLLFLERLENVVIELHDAEGVTRRRLSRRVLERPGSGDDSRIAYEVISIGPGRRRYLVARRQVDRDRLVTAVEASIDKEPQLARWRDWQGDPKVSVAIPLNATDAEPGRIYNFLPMAAEMPSPLAGHIDAPFYATIDRRRANFDLPLNAFLLDEVADTAVQAALELKSMPDVAFRNAVFDLAAWNPKDLDRLERVCAERELDWKDLELVPEAGGEDLWCSFQSAYVWEEKGYRLLRVRRLIKAGIENIADPDLGELRLDRICDILGAIPLRAVPNEQDLSSWLELVAGSLDSDGSSPKTWGTFYEESRKALPSVAALSHLGGKQVLRTRDGIQAAMGIEGEMPVFVREATGKRRKSGEAPLPPKSIASKFSMLDDDVPLSPEIISGFVKAKLVRRYDALEVLAEVPASFGDRPAPKRREEALKWAFDVWRAEGAKCEKVLDRIDLHVETIGGWRPATEARFSDGWTAQGRSLTTYLAEASSLSPDCREAAGMLLVSDASWIPKSAPLRKEWTEFLRVVGVEDGLPLLADDTAPKTGAPIHVWNPFLRKKERKVGRTTAWVAANSSIPLHNPWTDYSRRGELWRFPGQLEHQKMPPEARRRLAELAMVQAARGEDEWAQWRLGRYDRFRSDWNETVFRTPAAVFLAKSRWMPVDGDDEQFLRPDELWATTDGRRNPPRYVQRPKDRLVKLIESEEELSSALFSTAIGLRDWSSIGQVAAKLVAMATGASILHPGERVSFRKAYQQAWNEACSPEVDLPSDLPVFVMTSTGLAVSCGDPEDRPRIFVTGDQHSPETKAVLAAGEAVLALADDAGAMSAIVKLNDSGAFDALPIDAGQVGVLVDGIPLVVSNTDPLLASDGLEWLPEAAILANEVLGQALERQIPGGTVAERLRRVRLRRARTIQLSVGGKAVEEPLRFYALPDDDHPTLVIGDDEDITWSVLAEAAPALSTLLDGRMRSFETLLLRLAARRPTDDPRCRPSEEDLARALGCKVELVHDHVHALTADNSLALERFVPVIACLADLETAQGMFESLGEAPLRSLIVETMEGIADRLPCTPDELFDELGRPDLAEVRRRLDLGFGEFNRILASLGLPLLTNEDELRRLFDTWKNELSGPAVERIRRAFWPEFEAGRPLDRYVSMRELDFLEFQDDWILDREHMSKADVSDLLDAMLDEILGDDEERELEPLEKVRRASTRTLQRFIEANGAVVGAWCFANGVPDPWKAGPLAVVKDLSRLGILDFARVAEGSEIELLDRAKAWPAGMEPTVEPEALGLDPDDLMGEQERERERREQLEAEKRTIRFAGTPLDTRAEAFARSLIDLADDRMADGEWLTRSRRRFSLAEQAIREKSRSGKGGGRRRSARTTEEMRSAMGFASEYLASRFLAEKHKERYDDRCWVSENRGLLEVDWEGDDTLGFDFLVRTADVEWRYEVKSNLNDEFEFEFSQNEMRVAADCSSDGTRKYRILYVPFVFDPTRWQVMQLPNPLSQDGRNLFREIGAGATRLKFQLER